MNTIKQINTQREAQYRSATPPGHHPLAPIQGEYRIIDVEVKEQSGKTAHLATATWKMSTTETEVETVTFKFYLECLFSDNASFPIDTNIKEIKGRTITVFSVYRCQQINSVVFAAAWIFSKTDKSSSIMNYDLGQTLSEDDLVDIITNGLHLNETGIECENETEYEDLNTDEQY